MQKHNNIKNWHNDSKTNYKIQKENKMMLPFG